MPESRFSNLSSHDFELLTQDLLGEEWGVPLEGFMVGRDNGIDLRALRTESPSSIIVQCKHYEKSGFSKLKSKLRQDAKTANHLTEFRYVVATSVAMTPQRKAELAETLRTEGFANVRDDDIIGQEDIEALLRRHPKVERNHYKLWLTSSTVLNAVLNNATLIRTQGFLQRLEGLAQSFVYNASVQLANEILDEQHICLISGPPGVGKTTLASILLMSHVSDGYEPFVVSSDIDEAYNVFNRSSKQFFYYDDFLGRTSFVETMRKNEDHRLLDFLRLVRRHDSRLILTTREYILAQAAFGSEVLSSRDIDLAKFVLDVGKYTSRVRAEILYNHLYFSQLEPAYLEAVVRSKVYKQLIRHPNYNPRLIENVITLAPVSGVSGPDFPKFMLDTFRAPRELWKHIFTHQLSLLHRTLLSVIGLSEDVVAFEKLRFAHEAIRRQLKSSESFDDTLKVLEGTAVNVLHKDGKGYAVSFVNPGVADAVQEQLLTDAAVFEVLPHALTDAQQFNLLWNYATEEKANRQSSVKRNPQGVSIRHLLQPIKRSSLLRPVLMTRLQDNGDTLITNFLRVIVPLPVVRSRAENLILLLHLAEILDVQNCPGEITQAVHELTQCWSSGSGDKYKALRILKSATRQGSPCRGQLDILAQAADQWFANSLEVSDDYGHLNDLRELLDEIGQDCSYSEEELQTVFISNLSQLIEDCKQGSDDETIWGYLEDIEGAAFNLGLSIQELCRWDSECERILEAAAEDRANNASAEYDDSSEYTEDDDDRYEYYESGSSRGSRAEANDWVEDMYSTLLD